MKDSNDKNVTKTIEHYRPKTKTKSKMPAKINSDIHDIHTNPKIQSFTLPVSVWVLLEIYKSLPPRCFCRPRIMESEI